MAAKYRGPINAGAPPDGPTSLQNAKGKHGAACYLHVQGQESFEQFSNTINGISGVAALTVDALAHTVTVEYDPAYVNPNMIKSSVVGSGFPIDSVRDSRQEASQ